MTMSSLTRQVMAGLIHAHNLTAADLVELAKELGDSAAPRSSAGPPGRTVQKSHPRVAAACPRKSLSTSNIATAGAALAQAASADGRRTRSSRLVALEMAVVAAALIPVVLRRGHGSP